jgi:hypothetical protein
VTAKHWAAIDGTAWAAAYGWRPTGGGEWLLENRATGERIEAVGVLELVRFALPPGVWTVVP